MRELAIEQPAIALAESTGWYVKKMQYVGVRGCPDRHFYKRGRLLIVEFKKPGGVLDGHQVKRHRELREAGWKVHVIDNYEVFVRLLQQTEGEIRDTVKREMAAVGRYEMTPGSGEYRPPIADALAGGALRPLLRPSNVPGPPRPPVPPAARQG